MQTSKSMTGLMPNARSRISPVLQVWVTHGGLVVPRLDAPAELLFGQARPWFDEKARQIRVDRAGLWLLLELSSRPGVAVDEAVAGVAATLELGARARSDLFEVAESLQEAGLIVVLDNDGDAGVGSYRRRTLPVMPAGRPRDEVTRMEGTWACAVPQVFQVEGVGFAQLSHEGDIVRQLDVSDLLILSAFVGGATVEEAFARFGREGDPLDADTFAVRACSLADAGLLAPRQEDAQEKLRAALVSRFEAFAESDSAIVAAIEQEAARAARAGVRRLLVVPVDAYEIPMLSLGMVVAYAKAHNSGALVDQLGFAPMWYTKPDRFKAMVPAFAAQPAVFLFSHYLWTAEQNLAMSEMLKGLPNAITVHGGPNVPKYERDVERWFEQHPHVDVAVHGEGEATLAGLLEVLATHAESASVTPDLSVLGNVPGLTFRTSTGVCRTEDRERIADLDTIPSPYLTGLFDHRKRWQWPSAIFESNRGCPYGCTFCDWGSATLSRIRKFDLDRIKREMEWAAKHGLAVFSMADANFGIFDRDIEIVEHVVDLKRRYGAPTEFDVNFAKNRVANLAKIVQILASAGISTLSVASVQSFDAGVLKTIRRSNIKTERYDALTDEFRSAGFPLFTDVMIGLPGATTDTVRNDLQGAIDRELHVRANPTQLLVNSPMNEPAYREEHAIVAAPGEHLQQSATYTTDDWLEMMAIRRFFYFAERRGMLRQIATYVRVAVGVREVDFYDLLRRAGADNRRWPYIAYLVAVAPDEFVPPGSWRPAIDEIGRFCIDELGVADDTALRTAMTVQHAILPARGRAFPQILELHHDYGAWHEQVIAAKRGHTDGTWHLHVSQLRDMPPGAFTIDDHDDCCNRVIGQNVQGGITDVIWELDTVVARPKQPID